jgi:hypothetical protein
MTIFIFTIIIALDAIFIEAVCVAMMVGPGLRGLTGVPVLYALA